MREPARFHRGDRIVAWGRAARRMRSFAFLYDADGGGSLARCRREQENRGCRKENSPGVDRRSARVQTRSGVRIHLRRGILREVRLRSRRARITSIEGMEGLCTVSEVFVLR